MKLFLHPAGANPSGGYGRVKLALWQALIDNGVDVVPLGMGACTRAMRYPALLFGSPFNLGHVRPRPARPWLLTMAESDKIRPCWVEKINDDYEALIVPCPDLVTVYRDSGVEVPVFYVPLGVDFMAPPYISKPTTATRVYLTYSLGGSRKGCDRSIAAFKTAFEGRKDRELWIKCTEPRGTWVAGCNDDQMKVISGELTPEQWNNLLGSADAFLFPSRGEGFGLPPREATLAGTPAIATQWLGMWDVDCWGYAVPVDRKMPVVFCEPTVNADDARWVEPNLQAVIDHLLWIDGNLDAAKRRAGYGREYLLAHFTWKQAAQQIADLVQRVSF